MSVSKDEVLQMLRTEIKEIMTFMGNENANNPINEDAHLSKQLGLNSLDIMDFTSRAEFFYKLEISNDSYEDLYNIGLIADYICAELNKKNA